ncbi:hypothetical protein NB713_002929 [Xanthomonas sacchari]|nr:hypothetical protein [Xanthomonas sacchari]
MLWRRSVSCRVCAWLSRVCCASASCAWSAPTVSHAAATWATRVRRTLRWFSALDSQFCSASCLRLRSCPNRSSCQLLSPTCRVSLVLTWETPSSLLAALLRLRLMLALASNDGNCAARWMRYCARALSMDSTATRRSRLFCKANAMVWRSRGSRNTCCQSGIASVSVAAPAAGAASTAARSAGTGAAGRT